MKNTTKKIISAVLIIALLSVFFIAVFASDSEECKRGGEAMNAEWKSGESKAVSSLSHDGTAPAEKEAEDDDGGSVFFGFCKNISKNSEKILSAIAFLGTLILAFLYKKGLLPELERSLSGFAEALEKIKEKLEKAEGVNSDLFKKLEDFIEKLKSEAGKLEEYGEDIAELTEN